MACRTTGSARSAEARTLLAAAIGVLVLAAAELARAEAPAPFWRSFFARPGPVEPDAVGQARVALGGRLFADPRLSGDGSRSCASCHVPALGFTDGLARAKGRTGDRPRNTPTLWNLAGSPRLYWDGRAPSLEAQARVPIEHPEEMAGDLAVAAARLAGDPRMRAAFAAAFPSEPRPSPETLIAAIAAYERSLASPPTRFDAWIAGRPDALSPREVAGFRIFTGKGGCVACHGGWRFTDDRLHDIGLSSPDPGAGGLPGAVTPAPAFKTPTLRELAQTAPYMHDGSKGSLDEVVDHYAGGLVRRPSLAQNVVRDLQLTRAEREALVAFLRTLSSAEESRP